MRHDSAENVRFTNSPGYELSVLRAKIDYEHCLMFIIAVCHDRLALPYKIIESCLEKSITLALIQ
jgi:hypothetical protein